MLSKVFSYSLHGIDGYLTEVETDIHNGLPKMDIVGMGDVSIKESKNRVKSAIKNSGFEFPITSLTINLAPANLKKEGSGFDLAIAIGILVATKIISSSKVENFIFVGELSLDGSIRKINGVLPILISARERGFKNFVMPYENMNEAVYIDGINVYPIKSLSDAVDFLLGSLVVEKVECRSFVIAQNNFDCDLDFSQVKGQQSAKRALEIAAAGGHNVIMIGTPGSGKTMLAKCFPTILPDLTFDEALESTKIHSVAGTLGEEGILLRRPFRTPHHTATTVSLTGGNSNSKPGEISLAHNGVLFLDEMPEYSRQTLEALRQPLEDGEITVSRASQSITYPASFILIASMNPCPCGHYGSKTNACKCTPVQIHKYLSKLSGPLMDRIDLHVEVDNITYDDLKSNENLETSLDIKKRVDKARKIQQDRYKDCKFHSNSEMTPLAIKKFCNLDEDCENLLRLAFERLNLSARAHSRILKVARTIADLEGVDNISTDHIAEALQYRSLDKKYWA